MKPAPAAGSGPLPAEAHYQLIVDSIRDYAIFMLDPEGRITTWNAGGEQLKGYRAEEVIGQPISIFYSPEDVATGKPATELEIARRDDRCEAEGWRVRKDGSRFWANVVINALRASDGRVVGFAKVTRDLTGRLLTNEQFRLAIEAAPTGMLMVDESGRIALVNAQIERLFGYTREELLGRPIEMLVPMRAQSRHPGFRKAFFGEPRARPMGAGRDLFGLRKDQSEVPIEIGLNPLDTTEGRFVLSSVVDITERKRSEREREELLGQLRVLNAELEQRVNARTTELSATLKEREILLQEVHHRVKNNLQVISSLINMQMRKLDPGTSRDALQACQTRVQTIALIHEKLYQSKDYARVPFAEYVRSLVGNVFQASGTSPSAATLQVEVEDVALAVDKAIPCGLILNELITNALKHAFPERPGTIKVTLMSLPDGGVQLTVRDDGVGMPAGVDVRRSESLGMKLVTTLAEQLEASLEVTGGVTGREGSCFRLTFAR